MRDHFNFPNPKEQQFWLRMIRAAAVGLLVQVVILFAGSASAGSGASGDRDRLIDVYLSVAFGNETDHLTKPDNSKPTNIVVNCVAAEGCHDTISNLGRLVIAPWLIVGESDSFDPQNLISVVVYSDPKADDQRLGKNIKYHLEPDQKLFEDGTTECYVMSFYTEHVVDRIVVFVDQTMGADKTESCILLELNTGVGLNVGPGFKARWEPEGFYTNASRELFDRSMRGYERLLAMHLVKITEPGFTRSQVREALEKLSLGDLIGE